MKRILILAGSPFQIPVIKYAKKKDYYVITCDNRPENPGHKLSDKFVNMSTTCEEGILRVAIENKIDGILAYASDPAAPTAGYVSEKLGLPGNSYETVRTLGIKSRYRSFLKKNKFNCPNFIVIKEGSNWRKCIKELQFPLMVKPVDSAGSKGVTRIDSPRHIDNAITEALSFSRMKEIIIEEFVQKSGYQVGGEAYVYNGKLVMMCLGDQRVDLRSPYKFVPIGMTFPANLKPKNRIDIKNELQRALSLVDFRTGALNLEIMNTEDGKFFLMEIGPRSGGNLLPELMRYTCGFEVARYSVEHALGNDMIPNPAFETAKGFYAYHAIHSHKRGNFHGMKKDPSLAEWILEEHIFFKDGQEFDEFKHSGYVLGIWLLHFQKKDDLNAFFSYYDKLYKLS